MTDIELLKLAAKAAGYDGLGMWDEKRGYLWDGEGWTFDPLRDDGDALRLAVKLHIELQLTRRLAVATRLEGQEKVTTVCEEKERGEAIRRAIVEAAAEIGRTM